MMCYEKKYEVYEKKPASQGHVVWKGKSIFIAFSGNCGCPFLTLHGNDMWFFLKISCSMESETLSMKLFIPWML